MIHYSDDDVAWQSLKPRGEVTTHLEGCVDCSVRYASVQQFDAALSRSDSWSHPVNLRTTEDPTRVHLRDIASRLSAEISEAKRGLRPIIENSLPFIWSDAFLKQGFQTAGAVRVFSDAANSACERDPLHALRLADAALAIAATFDETDHYLGITVHQLSGLAWKERANALRYLGRFPSALDALDEAKRAYEQAAANPWDVALLLYTRGIVLYRLARASEAEECADEAASLFAAAGDSSRYVHARMLRASVRYWRQDFAGARGQFLALLSLATQDGDDVLAARLSAALANCDLDLGDAQTAEPILVEALRVFEREGKKTEAVRTKWALARVPLVEGHFAIAIAKLRACRLESERLGLTSTAAYITLDLAEALVAVEVDLQEVEELCRQLHATLKGAGMENEATIALAYLQEATRARTVTPEKVRHVRRFLVSLEDQPTLRFEPLPG